MYTSFPINDEEEADRERRGESPPLSSLEIKRQRLQMDKELAPRQLDEYKPKV